MRDAIFTLIAGVAGLPDALSTWTDAASSTDFIIETSSGLNSFGEIFVMRTPLALAKLVRCENGSTTDTRDERKAKRTPTEAA